MLQFTVNRIVLTVLKPLTLFIPKSSKNLINTYFTTVIYNLFYMYIPRFALEALKQMQERCLMYEKTYKTKKGNQPKITLILLLYIFP